MEIGSTKEIYGWTILPCLNIKKTTHLKNFLTRYPDEIQSSGIDPKELMEIYQFVPTAGLSLDLYSSALRVKTAAKHSDFPVVWHSCGCSKIPLGREIAQRRCGR